MGDLAEQSSELKQIHARLSDIVTDTNVLRKGLSGARYGCTAFGTLLASVGKHMSQTNICTEREREEEIGHMIQYIYMIDKRG